MTQCDQRLCYSCQTRRNHAVKLEKAAEQPKCTLRIYHFITHYTALPTVILSLQSGGNRNTNNVKTEIMAQGIIKYMA